MYIASAQPEQIISAIDTLNIEAGSVAAIFVAEHNKPNLDQLVSKLNGRGIEFFGGIFPAIIHGEKKYDEGAVVTSLPIRDKPFLIKGIAAGQTKLPDFEAMIEEEEKYTAIVLVDGLSANISLLLSDLFNHLGNRVNYLGGGAGSLSLQQGPCIFTPEGVFQDAAVIAFVKLGGRLGVRHGWQQLMGPIVATKTNKNIIVELNWRNAFEVYQEIVEADSGATLNAENFFSIAKGYPFGIYKEEAEDIVRDPIMVNEKGELVCVGEVPENAVLNILKGEPQSLVRAAGQAAEDCQDANGKIPRQSLVVDCISRSLFLEQDFGRELTRVSQSIAAISDACIPEGVLSLGEISSDGEGFLEFFNKTIVVGVLYE